MPLILYVEDEILLQMEGEVALKAAGYEVVTADDGADGCAVLRREGAGVHALITDVNLPGTLRGWHVADLAREVIPGLPVIYVTATERADFVARRVAGAVLIPKPFEWSQVLGQLASLLAR